MHSGRVRSNRLTGFARRLRHEETDAERKLWSLIRNGQIDGFKFRRQVPLLGFIADFYCVSARLVIELDGGQHFEPEAIAYDQARTRKFNGEGITVIRFTDIEMLQRPRAVVLTIENYLRDRDRTLTPPSPGVPGEGVKPAES
jgi:very-short-patch-repair endonuclease